MPTRPRKPCRHPGCPALVQGRAAYCAAHAPLHRRAYAPRPYDPAHNERYGSRWRRLRLMFLHAHPFCEECRKAGRAEKATEVHHVLPLSEGGTNDQSNLMALCKSCHSGITMRAENARRGRFALKGTDGG